MPPAVRVSQEQLGNLPGIQDAYVADTTAPAKAAIQVGRDLQNNQALAIVGSVFEQKEKRNVEDAYMRLQSANNAHLNGGAYTLTGDPLDAEDGGGFLTRRGKHAEGSDEEYRGRMQKVADRLTSKMNANERQQFERLYSHTTENGLASLRRNTEQEMFRYKSELTDATLKSAATAHLSTAINAFTQQQAFNNGALDMAQRKALSTDDVQSYAGARDAIAEQSKQQAVGVFTDWHNAITTEFDHVADFMRSQGMDEKTIAWRKQEFFQSQGVALTQSLSAKAQTATSETNAAEWLTMASKAAEVTLSPALKADALSGLEGIKNQRLQALLGLARNERDLDKQDRLVTVAENTARAFNASGKLLGAISEEADAIRSRAQRLESEFALQSLVDGKTYDPGTNERRMTALKMAQPKFEELKRKELNRTLTGNKEYIAGMIGAGAWLDPEGNVTAVDTESQKSILRSALYEGQIRIPDYNAQMSKIKSIEQSGQKEQHLKAAAEICSVLGTDIKALWKDSLISLDEKTDPNKKLSSYSFTETETKLVDEMAPGSNVGTYTGVGFIPSVSEPTGRKIEQTTQIKRKRDIFAGDIPKLVNLLIAADSADGLLVDLDGNPQTPATKVERQKFKEQLFRDLKNKVMSVDIDTQAKGIFEALSKRARDTRVLEATSISKNAGLGLPASEANQSESDNDN